MGQTKASYSEHDGGMAPDYTGAVQQLMFNRILRALKVAAIDGVTITRFDPKTGTLEGVLHGVTFVVNVSVPLVVEPDPN
jgi:hypothetical protein